MFIRLPGILVLLIVVALVGCSGDRTPKQKTDEGETRKANKTQPNPKGKSGTEAEAKAALKKALDSWAFGDSNEKFEQDHPDIKFGDLNRAARKKLSRYEFGNSRKDGKGFQFLVTLTLATEDGKNVTLNGDYTIAYSNGEWGIFGGAPVQ